MTDPEEFQKNFEAVVEHLNAVDFQMLVENYKAAKKCGGSYTPRLCEAWTQIEAREKTLPGYYKLNQWMLSQCFGIDPP